MWVPCRIKAETTVEFDPSCEALIFALDGTPLHGERFLVIKLIPGITGGPNTLKDGKPGEQEDRRVEHIIPPEKVQAGSYEVIIEVSCNSMFGLGPYRYQTPDVSVSISIVLKLTSIA